MKPIDFPCPHCGEIIRIEKDGNDYSMIPLETDDDGNGENKNARKRKSGTDLERFIRSLSGK